MQDGTQVQFRSVALQKYMSAENGGGMGVTVDRDVPSSWETFRVRYYFDFSFFFSLSSLGN